MERRKCSGSRAFASGNSRSGISWVLSSPLNCSDDYSARSMKLGIAPNKNDMGIHSTSSWRHELQAWTAQKLYGKTICAHATGIWISFFSGLGRP
jgi:hypothetical protein